MTNLHKKRIRVDKLDIHYVTGGSGDPLIVLHGGANGAGAWIENIEELARNYTVYLPDLPGYGRSQPMDGRGRPGTGDQPLICRILSATPSVCQRAVISEERWSIQVMAR